jgi:hypothetical protein
VASKRNSRKAQKRMMMRAAAKAPNWVRDIAGSKSFRGTGHPWRRSMGKFGAASPVRHIVKDGQSSIRRTDGHEHD